MITKRINQDFWNSDSVVSHSWYVGSYGRGTSIYTSDIDIVVEIPWTEYERYDNYLYNGQSSLLATLRNSLLKTYSSSKVSADGQVVDIMFLDGIKFEVVPAFRYSDGSGFCYPDTNNGGSWRSMDPEVEIGAFNYRNNETNKNLKKLCRMVRAWKENKTVLMSGILIDSIVYNFMFSYQYAKEPFIYYDWISRDFFKYVYDNADKRYWDKPGSTGLVERKYDIKDDAKFTYDKACEAIEDGEMVSVFAGIMNGGKYMAQDFQTHKEKLYQQLKEQYGKVVYTYTAHLKNAGFLQRDCNRFKWVQIILSAISTGGFVATVIMDEAKIAWVGGMVSTALLVVNGYLKSKDFASEEQKHIDVANSLWSIREDYISVLTDFDALSENEIMEKRELLKDRTAKVYENAIQTDKRSYAAAQQALQKEEEQFFHEEELVNILPQHLRQ